VSAPGLHDYVLPIALVVLTVLFMVQHFGTSLVGRLFGPVMVIWFAVLAAASAVEVARQPGILRALSPTYGVVFIADHGEGRVRRPRIGRPRGHRRGGPLRRHRSGALIGRGPSGLSRVRWADFVSQTVAVEVNTTRTVAVSRAPGARDPFTARRGPAGSPPRGWPGWRTPRRAGGS